MNVSSDRFPGSILKGLLAKVFVMLACILFLTPGAGFCADTARQEQAAGTAMDFMRELGGALKKQLAAGGPAGAVDVCGGLAPSIAGRISRETGWKVTRVGTRVRNPLLGMPDSWELNVLDEFGKRAARGEDIDKMSYSQVVTESNGEKFFRYMKAIAVKQPCLACHGTAEQISPEVKTMLKERYPHDQATGYKVGDLRGAISIKEPLQ